MSSLLCLPFTLRATPTPSSEAFGCANATRYKGFLYLHNNIRNNIFSPPTLGQPVLFAVLGMNIHLSLIGTKQEDNGREGGCGLQFFGYRKTWLETTNAWLWPRILDCFPRQCNQGKTRAGSLTALPLLSNCLYAWLSSCLCLAYFSGRTLGTLSMVIIHLVTGSNLTGGWRPRHWKLVSSTFVFAFSYYC